MKGIVIFGAGGHAKVIADIVEKQGERNILGFLDDNIKPGTVVYGYKVLGGKTFLYDNADKIEGGIIGIGDNWVRKRIVEDIKNIKNDFCFFSAIHPSSTVGRGVQIGDGSVVMAGSIINSDANIGEHCIINTKSSVGHDSILFDYVTIAPNATVAGGVTIGECSTMSISSTVIHGKTIGKHTVIGAGASVIKDIPSNVVAYGTPAKIKRTREENEKYL